MKIMFFARKHTSFTWPIFVTNLFFSFHYAATLYISSSYLENFFTTEIVSLLFVISAIGNIILFLLSPYLLKHLGNRKFLFALLSLEIFSTIGLALGSSSFSVATFFIIRGSILMLIYYSLDIFLEEVTPEKRTGSIRGFYLTLMSLAIACAPLLIAKFGGNNNYQKLYWISAFILVLPLLLSIFSFHNKKIHPRHTETKSLPFRTFWNSKSIKPVALAAFALEFFYAYMIIYTPIYLHEILKFPWSEIGISFTIMLLPFVILEWPVGILADKKYGEKEIMSLGFFLTGISLITMPFIGKTIVLWTLILFLSRIGASLIEVTTETYFFKHVDSRDTGLINIYRLARPLAIVIAPIIGFISIYFLSYTGAFFIVALVIMWGLKQTLHLRDTQ